jgi:predicted nuclease with RNAse H fold
MTQETVGIDVAAQAGTTAACAVVWQQAGAEITHVEAGLDDGRLLDLLSSEDAQRIGVDVPLGWPTAFVDALARHHRGEPWGDLEDPPKGKTLTHRATDRWVHDQPDLKLWPLSVSTDRIAYSAMRVARLLGQLGHSDRSGEGRVVEVYPAAALKCWGLSPRQYKRADGRPNLSRLLQQLREAAPWLKAEDEIWGQVEGDDNQFDALICALVARAVARNQCRQIPVQHRATASVEGWIHIPLQGSLQRLLD